MILDITIKVLEFVCVVIVIPVLAYVVAKMWTFGTMRAKREMEDQNGKR